MEIQTTQGTDGPAIKICGELPRVDLQLVVPKTLKATISYGVDVPSVNIDLELQENKYEITNMQIVGAPVSTGFLTKLSLPKNIRAIAEKVIPNSNNWAKVQETKVTDEYLVQLYWFEHLTWGRPREAIMNATGWSRANTNHHLRRLAKTYELPGPHSAK